MSTAIKALGFIKNYYPVKKFLHSRVVNYFIDQHVAEILENAAPHFQFSSFGDASGLLNRRAFKGLIQEIFQNQYYYPTPKDIAVAINVAYDVHCEKSPEYKSQTINLAFHIATEIKRRISSDEILKTAFKDLRKNIDKLSTTHELSDIEQCFEHKSSLFSHYFNSFKDDRFSYEIKVWHSGEDKSWIEWKDEDSLTVKVNPARIRSGFFLIGFDYYNITSNMSLSHATTANGYEVFNGKPTQFNRVWTR